MPTSPYTQNETTEEIEVEDGVMFEREGFDTPGLRRELASVSAIDLTTTEIERDEQEFVDPRTVDMPFGPSGLGETGGAGIEKVRVDGEEWRTYRYANGFEYNVEEGMGDIDTQIQAILETFDFLADANFFKGIEDRRGGAGKMRPGVLEYLKSNIPAERTIDCENFDGDAGDEEDYTEAPESIIKYEAYSRISGDLLTRNEPNWDLMIGSQQGLARMNKPTKTQTGRQTYRQLINAGNAKGGILNDMLVPNDLELDTVPLGGGALDDETPKVDLSTEIDDNELILIPDLEVAARDWMRLSEMPEPEAFRESLRMGREARDFVWRYSHKFDPRQKYPDLKDAIHLTNIDVLFN